MELRPHVSERLGFFAGKECFGCGVSEPDVSRRGLANTLLSVQGEFVGTK